jgi:hypothetical protein
MKRAPLKIEVGETWRYVRERLVDPSACAKGQYRTVAVHRAKGVNVVACCPRGQTMRRDGCYRGNRRVGSGVVQALLHDREKYRWRHAALYRRLMQQRPDARGVRRLTFDEPMRRAEGMSEALGGMFE